VSRTHLRFVHVDHYPIDDQPFAPAPPPVSCFITCPNPSPGSFLLGMSGLPPGSYLVGRDCDLPLRGKPPTLVQCVSLENKTALKWSLIR
jgi:hypothetical protein